MGRDDELGQGDKEESMGESMGQMFGGGGGPEAMAEHTVAEGETLSSISMKYYDSADKDDWMAIYEANKGVIGDNPNVIKPGQVLKIPSR